MKYALILLFAVCGLLAGPYADIHSANGAATLYGDDVNPLIAGSTGETVYVPTFGTPVYQGGISSPVLIDTQMYVTYEPIADETTYNITRRVTVVTNTYEEYLRVGAIQ